MIGERVTENPGRMRRRLVLWHFDDFEEETTTDFQSPGMEIFLIDPFEAIRGKLQCLGMT